MTRVTALAVTLLLAVGARAQPPNIVVVYTDDQRYDEVAFMPNLVERVAEQGVSMERFYTVTPLCCPARATLLRGQYAHSHGILTSRGEFQGGWDEWRRRDLGASTVATWLHDAGYRTGFYGKYINGYPSDPDTTYVPPGWDDWLGGFQRLSRGAFYDWRANSNGRVVRWGQAPEDYRVDVEGEHLTQFIAQALDDGQPFFALYAPITPHAIGSKNGFAVPPTPAPRHQGTLADLPGLRLPSYDEADVSDKTTFIQRLPRLTPQESERIDDYRRTRAEALLAVDDVLGAVLDTLESRGALDNTYVVFTSDNGFHLGEHRLPPERKGLPYEASVRMPAYIRGPGIAPGSRVIELVSNLDLAPTLAQWAGAAVPDFIEGRSFGDIIRDPDLRSPRTALLNERWISAVGQPVYFQSVVTERYKLIRWSARVQIEVYDLHVDPFEMNSLHDTRPALRDSLLDVFHELEACQGADCRVADTLWTVAPQEPEPEPEPVPVPDTVRVVGPYPNPADAAIAVRLTSPEPITSRMRIVDALGRTVLTRRVLIGRQEETITLDTAGLTVGTYALEIRLNAGAREVRRFVVIR